MRVNAEEGKKEQHLGQQMRNDFSKQHTITKYMSIVEGAGYILRRVMVANLKSRVMAFFGRESGISSSHAYKLSKSAVSIHEVEISILIEVWMTVAI